MGKLLCSLLFSILFFSCQKEVSLENGYGNNAIYFFKGSPNTCTLSTPNGYYAPGVALSATNTVSIEVNVIVAGEYNITTNTTNGYGFSASGTFTSPGVQTVVLKGDGTPLTSQTDIFTVVATGIAGCSFTVTVSAPVPATYTLSGAPGACTVATVNGIYGLNQPLTSNNTVTVEVNVTTIGTYSLSTNTVSGMTFTKSGSFTQTGVQQITLVGSGTPTVSGENIFTIGSSGCRFSVQVLGPAAYTLSGAPGACTVATINGTYGVNQPLTGSNTVTVQVNVSTIGTYILSTNTVGGMTFTQSGIFATTGVQTVILNGNGTPTTSGGNTFTVGTGGCTFTINVVGPAVFTLDGAPGACTIATVNGTYTKGTPLSSSNTVTVQVNVSTIGSYTLSTGTVGGITFTQSGMFTATGIQTVTLTGSGIPTTSGANTFTVGTGGCTFDVTVVAPPIPTGTYSCKVDGVLVNFNEMAKAEILDDFYTPPRPYLFMRGYTPIADDEDRFTISISKNDQSHVGPGTYHENGILLPNGYQIGITYPSENPDGTVTIWSTSSTFLSPNPPFTINVTSVTATRVKGTFNGKLTNVFQGSTQQKTITEGVFDLPIN